MADIHIRRDGALGRITLNRPAALNALTYDMVLAIDAALDGWGDNDDIACLLIDAAGERAFCSGGDIAEMYATGTSGDYGYGRKFWRDEYRMNARLHAFPKPVISLMQGYTMGGGVGVGCHASHRIVGESSQIAMPECGVGLVPDVGGSLMLAQAPGRLGEYLGTTGARMGPGDAILAGFADYFVPQDDWPALTQTLISTGDCEAVNRAAQPAPASRLAALQPEIDEHFAGEALSDILQSLSHADSPFAADARKLLARGSPLSMACAIEMTHRLRGDKTLHDALALEYRFTFRAMEKGDFLEGIRAAIIDRDRSPHWRHPDPEHVPLTDVSAMLMPLGPDALTFEETQT